MIDQQQSTDRSVTPVVGIAAVIGITTIAAMVLALGANGIVQSEEAAPVSDLDFQRVDGCLEGTLGDRLVVTHTGGETLAVDHLHVVYSGVGGEGGEAITPPSGSVPLEANTEQERLRAGETVAIGDDAARLDFSEADLRLVWEDGDSSFSLVHRSGTVRTTGTRICSNATVAGDVGGGNDGEVTPTPTPTTQTPAATPAPTRTPIPTPAPTATPNPICDDDDPTVKRFDSPSADPTADEAKIGTIEIENMDMETRPKCSPSDIQQVEFIVTHSATCETVGTATETGPFSDGDDIFEAENYGISAGSRSGIVDGEEYTIRVVVTDTSDNVNAATVSVTAGESADGPPEAHR